MVSKRSILALLAGILLLTVWAAYYPVTRAGFVNFDDPVMVTNNAAVQHLTPAKVGGYFVSFHHGLYHPLVLLSYAAEVQLFGMMPSAFHVDNLYLHLGNTLLVFALVLLLDCGLPAAFITALLFGLHPLHVESVAWISERKDVLYAFFFLASLVAWLRYRAVEARRWYYAALLLFLLSLLSKPMAVTLPLLLALFELRARRRWNGERLRELAPFFLLSAVFAIVAYVGQHVVGVGATAVPFAPASLWNGLFTAAHDGLFYLGKLFVPVHLSCIYPRTPALPWAAVAAAGIIAAALRLARRDDTLLFGLSFFVAALLPVLQVVPCGLGVAADRFTYVPSIGIFLVVGVYGGRWFSSGRGRVAWCLAVFLAAGALGWLTFQRTQVWSSSAALFDDALRSCPGSAVAHTNRGMAWLSAGNEDKAMEEFTRALAADPFQVDTLINRGQVYLRRGEHEKALEDLRRALRRSPRHPRVVIGMGDYFASTGRTREALRAYDCALAARPDSWEALRHRGMFYRWLGEREKAARDLERASFEPIVEPR